MDIIKIRQDRRNVNLRTIYDSVDLAMRTDANVDEEKLIAECQFRFGAARRTVLEYLKELELVDKIVREDGKVFTKAGYEAELILKKSEVPKVEKIQEVKQ